MNMTLIVNFPPLKIYRFLLLSFKLFTSFLFEFAFWLTTFFLFFKTRLENSIEFSLLFRVTRKTKLLIMVFLEFTKYFIATPAI